MTQTTVMVNGVEVASTLPPSTHINIHIHQKSALEQLLGAMGSLKKFLSYPQATGASKASLHHGQLALGVTQILLGLMSCVLGVCISYGPQTKLCDTGCAFWSGSMAIVAGVGIIEHEKRQGKLSGCVSLVFLLACMATAGAATAVGVTSLIWQTRDPYHFKIISVCGSSYPGMGREYRMAQLAESSDWRTETCREYLNMMMNLFLSFCIMLTVACVLINVVSVASLALSLQSINGRSSQALNEEETEKKLLAGDSAPSSPIKEKIPVIL
ncbi:transmembrane protein 176B [Acomys russatus]|uniref:transmembrane protein 176B n=1 Tax=Acomys russatus TaxID=60746 RepID=UPI0021E2DCED|nr:transmembrane protein 176B [Acomys russatus]